jgi:putative DNA primase/helicase
MDNVLEEFRAAIAAAGLEPPDVIEGDGLLHRFNSSGKRGDRAGWYKLHLDARPAGIFGDWRTGYCQSWSARRAFSSPDEQRAHRERVARRQREAEAARAAESAAKSALARKFYQQAQPLVRHPYLDKKGIAGPAGLRVEVSTALKNENGEPLTALHGLLLLVPIYSKGVLVALQLIDSAGAKRFVGSPAGGAFVIGRMAGAQRVALVEGLATGVSVYEAIGWPTVVALTAGNLLAVAKRVRQLCPYAEVLIAGDNDLSGVGQRAAEEAARAVAGLVALPSTPGSDWNDVATRHGIDSVRAGIERRVRVRATA